MIYFLGDYWLKYLFTARFLYAYFMFLDFITLVVFVVYYKLLSTKLCILFILLSVSQC